MERLEIHHTLSSHHFRNTEMSVYTSVTNVGMITPLDNGFDVFFFFDFFMLLILNSPQICPFSLPKKTEARLKNKTTSPEN